MEYKFVCLLLPKGLVFINNTQTPLCDATLFFQLVRKFIFLTIIRSNIAYTLNKGSNFMSKPKDIHLEATKHILYDIKYIMDYGICYHKEGSYTIIKYI